MRLSGRGVYLQHFKASDAGALLDLNVRNREFFQLYLSDRPDGLYTLDYQLRSIRADLELATHDQAYSFGIFLADSDELVGKAALTEIVRGPLQSAWLGYYLDAAQAGRGHTTEAVRLLVDHAFADLRLHRIEAGVMPHNRASIRVLEKAGFLLEGLSRKNVRIDGRWEDHLHFAVINPDD